MEEYTSIYNQSLSPEDEISMSLFSPENPNKILLLLIPLGLLFLFRNRDNYTYPIAPYSSKSTNTYKPMASPFAFDGETLDKMRRVLDGLKKAQTIQGLRKSMASSGGTPGKMNMEVIKELIEVMGPTLGGGNKSQINNITNIMSMLDKVKDVKKIMDVQKATNSESEGDSSSQINNIIDMIGPMLPEGQAKNIESFKKMAQMMKFMSAFEGSEEDGDDNESNSEEEEDEPR